jgi:hypothetical protein
MSGPSCCSSPRIAAVALSLALAGCSGDDPTATPSPTSSPAPSATRTEAAPILLPIYFWITNQSLEIGLLEVQISLSVDSDLLFDESMAVGTQHTVATVEESVLPGT